MESWKGHLIVEEGAEGGIGTAGVNICPKKYEIVCLPLRVF